MSAIRVKAMAAALASVDAYAAIPESHITTIGNHNRLRYLVEETGAANGITAKVQGRHLSENFDGNTDASDWVDIGNAVAVAAGSSTEFGLGPDLDYDEYRVMHKATVGASQGATKVFGGAKHRSDAEDLDTYATNTARTIGAEAANVINVAGAMNQSKVKRLVATLYDVPAAAGDLVRATTGDFISAIGTDGTTVIGTATDQHVFDTEADGTFDLDITDVAGASGQTIMCELRDGSPNGRVVDLFAVIFD